LGSLDPEVFLRRNRRPLRDLKLLADLGLRHAFCGKQNASLFRLNNLGRSGTG
jgi:hypothetical protein